MREIAGWCDRSLVPESIAFVCQTLEDPNKIPIV